MSFSPDALHLGPLALGWERLALILALGVWLSTARFKHAGGAALVTLVAARLAHAVPHWPDLAPTLPGQLLALLDVRSGGFLWPAGLLAGLAYLVVRLRAWPPALTRTVLLSAAAAAIPLFIRPAAPTTLSARHVTLTRVTPSGAVSSAPFTSLPRPAVVNVWATWCGPCRAELPVLARAIHAGEPVVLVNAREDPQAVRAFLRELGVEADTYVDDGSLLGALNVTGYPSTFVIDANGDVTARHFGQLDAPQLKGLLQHAKDPRP